MPKLDFVTWANQQFELYHQRRGTVYNYVIVGTQRGWFEKEFKTQSAAYTWMRAQYDEYIRLYAARTRIQIVGETVP
jgi:hypothetical protein